MNGEAATIPEDKLVSIKTLLGDVKPPEQETAKTEVKKEAETKTTAEAPKTDEGEEDSGAPPWAGEDIDLGEIIDSGMAILMNVLENPDYTPTGEDIRSLQFGKALEVTMGAYGAKVPPWLPLLIAGAFLAICIFLKVKRKKKEEEEPA
jgi:hypothetical protein